MKPEGPSSSAAHSALPDDKPYRTLEVGARLKMLPVLKLRITWTGRASNITDVVLIFDSSVRGFIGELLCASRLERRLDDACDSGKIIQMNRWKSL